VPAPLTRALSPNKLGGILRLRREQLGLSIRETADRIGISPSYLVGLEHGHNPSTGRAPVPSPPILAAIARVFDIQLTTLLEVVGAPASRSAHLLLYQTGAGHPSPLKAAQLLFAGHVDSWIEIVDPRRPAGGDSMPNDVLVMKRRPLSWARSGRAVFSTRRALANLSELLAELPRTKPHPRLGIVFGANSAVMRSIDNPNDVLESETTWEDDVATRCRSALGIEPAANVCVYRQADVQEVSSGLDPLAIVLRLIETHPHVAVQERSGAVMTGPAAIETILAAARPGGISSETWESVARAAAVGLARAAMPAHIATRTKDT
jgi:transcriptional regulator with XRE-family HTH domain